MVVKEYCRIQRSNTYNEGRSPAVPESAGCACLHAIVFISYHGVTRLVSTASSSGQEVTVNPLIMIDT